MKAKLWVERKRILQRVLASFNTVKNQSWLTRETHHLPQMGRTQDTTQEEAIHVNEHHSLLSVPGPAPTPNP